MSLVTVLESFGHVDLVDVDIQGAEADALKPAANALTGKVKRMYVATHDRDNEERLRALFGRLGWTSVYDYPRAGYPRHRGDASCSRTVCRFGVNPGLS